MSNPYYTRTAIISHALGRSAVLNAQLQAIEEAFDEVYNDVAALGEGVSSTSMTIGTGNKTFAAGSGRFQIGQFLTIASTLSPQNLMFGEVVAADQVTSIYTVNVIYTTGSGTYSAWTLALSSPGLLAFTTSSIDSLTNKTISVDDNTINGLAASSFALTDGTGKLDGAAAQKAIPAGAVVGTSDAQTLTNKTITYAGNSPSGFQPTLVSGTSIKTINGASLLGAGDIAVETTASLVATGTIGSNVAVSLRSDGTVEVTTGTVTGETGTRVAANAAASSNIHAACFDSTNNKIVVFYQQTSGSTGFCVVGTVSGTTISFGTPVSIGDAATYCSIAFAGSGKVICTYRNGSNVNRCIVGTVSGTTISFGTAANVGIGQGNSGTWGIAWSTTSSIALFGAYDLYNNQIELVAATLSGTTLTAGTMIEPSSNKTTQQDVAVAWDSVSNKFLVAWGGRAMIVTNSGTTLTAGSQVVFDAAISAGDTCYSINIVPIGSSKVVVAWCTSAGVGKVAVCDLSGSTPSFGDVIVFQPTNAYAVNVSWSPAANKGIIVYADATGSSYYGIANQFTVSGNSIVFEGAFTWRSAAVTNSAAPYYPLALAFDANVAKWAIAYRDAGSSNYIHGIVVGPGTTISTNVANFIGFAVGSFTNGQTAKVTVRYQVDSNRSGLTARTQYYMDPTGAIVSYPTAYRAGYALSSTKIITGV